ncbi:hypothetical protein J3R82DRAFT_2372 [Butyriboletus roseoflavus]|nr:hypothetical protein J3R82DRAFT_2372 [Butyriboletus roseoflavus]
MDNPWANAWDNPPEKNSSPWKSQETDTAWSEWPATGGTDWLQGDAPWDPSTDALQSQDMTLEQDITTQDQSGISQLPSLTVSEPTSATHASVSDLQVQVARSTSPPRDSFYPVPETTSDTTPHNIASVARASVEENIEAPLNPPDSDWGVGWGTTPSEANPKETQPPDQWEAARQEKEKLNRAVPPGLLDSLLRHCQQVSQEIWPVSEASDEVNRSSGFDDLVDMYVLESGRLGGVHLVMILTFSPSAALLAQLLPADSALPPIVQFSTTATSKAMNEALKLTRHMPTSASSPLSRLLASKGSLEWEKSIKTKQDIVPDTAHAGWRVLEKEDRLSTVEESKPRKAAGGLLSFWNRRASAIQATPIETPSEPSVSPARSSSESVKSVLHPPSPHAAPSAPPSLPPDSQPTVIATATAPSAVSRFLNRFSRIKGPQHSALALSSDDLEFLSEIVPSASDPPDEDIDDGNPDALTAASNSSPLPPKLPPPTPPPSKQPMLSTRPSSALGLGTLNGVSVIGSIPTTSQMQGVDHTPNVPVLVPPLSPKPAASFSRTQSPLLPLKDVATPTIAFGQLSTPSIQQRLQPIPQPNSQPHSSFTHPPPQKVPLLLSIPPLLPPPPVSPPQTPRPSVIPPIIIPGHSSTMQTTDTSLFHDSYDSDDEFTAFASFPSSALAPFPPLDSYPSQRSPLPPSPPPRRTYEHTHYPSSSSISSILSPASQTSVDQLCSTRSSVSASLDSFDDFVSPPSVARGENRKPAPSPPPLPIKPRSQLWQPSHIRVDALPSRVHHAHTSSQTFASPTVHTSLVDSAFSVSSVSDAEHQRTQILVNHAAVRGGVLWPNSPDSDERKVMAIPSPASSSTSPNLIGEEGFDLLGDGNTLGGGLETWPAPVSAAGGFGMVSTVSSPVTGASRAPFGVPGGKGLGSRDQLQPSPLTLPSTSTPILSLSSPSTPFPATATNAGSLQPAKPKQTGGLSAQDLSFFEGL